MNTWPHTHKHYWSLCPPIHSCTATHLRSHSFCMHITTSSLYFYKMPAVTCSRQKEIKQKNNFLHFFFLFLTPPLHHISKFLWASLLGLSAIKPSIPYLKWTLFIGRNYWPLITFKWPDNYHHSCLHVLSVCLSNGRTDVRTDETCIRLHNVLLPAYQCLL